MTQTINRQLLLARDLKLITTKFHVAFDIMIESLYALKARN